MRLTCVLTDAYMRVLSVTRVFVIEPEAGGEMSHDPLGSLSVTEAGGEMSHDPVGSLSVTEVSGGDRSAGQPRCFSPWTFGGSTVWRVAPASPLPRPTPPLTQFGKRS